MRLCSQGKYIGKGGAVNLTEQAGIWNADRFPRSGLLVLNLCRALVFSSFLPAIR
jgi:hypothetical protein